MLKPIRAKWWTGPGKHWFVVTLLLLSLSFICTLLEQTAFAADDPKPEELDVDAAVKLGMAKLEEVQRLLNQRETLKALYQLKLVGAYFNRAPEDHAEAIYGRGMQLGFLGEILWRNGQKEEAMEKWIAASKQLIRLSGEKAESNLRTLVQKTARAAMEIGSYEQGVLSLKNLYKIDVDQHASRNQLVEDLDNLGVALMRTGKLKEADYYFEIGEGSIAEGGVSGNAQIEHNYNRGLVLSKIGNPGKAVQYFEKSLLKLESTTGTETRQAEVLLDLAVALDDIGKPDDARKRLKQAFTLVKNDPEAQLLALKIELEIAIHSEEVDTDPRAYAAHLQELIEKTTGIPDNEEIRLVGLSNLGFAFKKAGETAQAIAAYNRAVELLKNTKRRDYAEELHQNLAILFAMEKNSEEANAHFLRSLNYKMENLAADLPALTDLSKYSRLNSAHRGTVNSIHTLSLAKPSSAGIHGLQAALWTKALYSEVCRREQPMLHNVPDSAQETLVAEYKELRRKVSKRVLEKRNGTNDAQNAEMTRLVERMRKVELSIRENPAVYREEYRFDLTPVRDVVARLRPGEVLLEYVAFDPPSSPFSEKDETHYGVYVAIGGQAKTRAFPLGVARRIDAAILRYRETLESQQFYDANDEKILRQHGETLRQLLLDPVFETFENINRLYIAPDGLIGLVPFESFPVSSTNERYLVETTPVLYLTTGRDLVAARPGTNSGTVWLVGDPSYDATEEERITEVGTSSRATIGPRKAEEGARGKAADAWERLPYTRDAIQQISILTRKAGWPTSVFVDGAASEESLLLLNSPRILVMATHGEFLRETPTVHVHFQSSKGFNEDLYESANPLHRTMLVLAGANQPTHRVDRYLLGGKLITGMPLQTQQPALSSRRPIQHELGDGLLTAYEVRDMNLQGTELVVLLGCESALGVTQRGETSPGIRQPDGEGVAGLRQSFVVAGAQSLIMSMWKVPDQDSIRQINTFFDVWLSSGKSRYEAFRVAQLKALKDARASRGSSHPFWWAGFIYYGQPGDRSMSR